MNKLPDESDQTGASSDFNLYMIDYKAAFEAVMTEYGVFEELCEHIEQECSCNRPQLERSESCICFSCGRAFKVSEIIEWCDDDMRESARACFC